MRNVRKKRIGGFGRLCRAAAFGCAFTLAGSALSRGADPAYKLKSDEETPAAGEAREEINGLMKLAKESAEHGNMGLAESFYNKLVDLSAPDSDKKDALWQMAGTYEKARVFSKAIAVYEKINSLFPEDRRSPELFLKLGLLYREIGASRMAISRFYSVLNSSLRLDGDFEAYKALTQKAQFEIGETYFLEGEYADADKFFELLKRLDLTPEDKEKAEYKSTYCLFLMNDYPGAMNAAKNFAADFPDAKDLAQCRYILVASLKALNRTTEATQEVVALIQAEAPKQKTDPADWAYWQKKAGNQLANDCYQHGEFLDALTIYQALAKLTKEPEWRLPVVYQIGLCFERLGMTPRALEAYQFILDECKKTGDGTQSLPSSLETLRQIAQWRSEQLSWKTKADGDWQDLMGTRQEPPESQEQLQAKASQ